VGVPADKAVRLIVAEPSGVYAEAIRSARRELDSRRRRPGPRIVLVTSALPKEGADIVASNLAHHYAMTGTRVLLADADWRRQPLTQQLAPQRLAGFADQLIAYQPVESAVLRDGMTGLHFLPAAAEGTISGSIPELLASQVTADALLRLRSAFDVIVLSVPPLLPVSDGRILADYADQIVFVMTWQKTPKSLAKKALQTLGANQSKIAGVVMSEVADDMEKAIFPLIGRSEERSPLDTRHAA
jgi:capsular exopolysaccharide synthesis family protein